MEVRKFSVLGEWEIILDNTVTLRLSDTCTLSKVIPLQAWTGHKSFRRSSLPEFLDSPHM
jgi:hypothetical protein